MAEGAPVAGTRGRIVAAAFDLLAVRGVRALTLDGVAGHAKLSKGAVLYHFKGKDELIETMLQHAIAGCMAGQANGGVLTTWLVGGDPWRHLVWALVAAMSMSPQVVKENGPLFEELSRTFLPLDSGKPPVADTLAFVVGSVFLREIGLGPDGRWRQ